MDTNRELLEIETALARPDKFNFIKNIVVFNVNGINENLPIYHECDMLVLSKSGYLTEIEIKRSWSDFLADFKKKHNHHNYPIIKYFYYCVPVSIYETGIITYDEELNLTFHGHRVKMFRSDDYRELYPQMWGEKKLYLEQKLELARLGTMRIITLKENILKLKNKLT